MNTYSAYKDSGEQWLGQIPAHWEMHKLGHFLSIFSEKGFPNAQLLSVTREQGVILRDKDNKEENHNFVPDDLSGYKHLSKGDFVINKMKSWQGSYGVSEYDGIVSPAYFTCKLKGVYPDFFSRAIRSKAYSGYFMKYSKGIRVDQWDLDPIALKLIPFAFPPIKEQEAMVAYLDEQTAQIDSAIAREQKMIDLLEERKQIIIQQAVTKGLNPNAKMKDSGIEWIGTIPESWRKKRFKYLFKTSTGITFTKAQLESEGNPVLSYGQVHSKLNKSGTLNEELIKFIPNSLTAGKDNCLVYNGDFIFADTSEDFEGCGNNIYVDTEYPVYAGYHTIIARKQNDEYGKYLGYLFASKAWRGQVRTRVNGVKVYSITQGILNGSWVILPPKAEQIAIAEYLDKVIGVIDKEEAHRNRLISLLRERKQIIINEVVTGKIKVS